jgi:hypothetical protein
MMKREAAEENKTRRLYGIAMKEPETMGFEQVDDQKKQNVFYFLEKKKQKKTKFTGELYGRHDHPSRLLFLFSSSSSSSAPLYTVVVVRWRRFIYLNLVFHTHTHKKKRFR